MQANKSRWKGVLVALEALNVGDGVAEDPYREATILEQLHHPHIRP